MKAIVLKSERLTDLALMDVPVPKHDENELLVQIKAIGVGIHDGYFLPKTMSFPYTIGIEAAGIIKAIGSQVSDFKVGDHIVFISMMQPKGGVWAEYAVVDKDSLILLIPKGMNFTQAAAIPVAGGAAIRALGALELKSEDTLFIAGASGAIGTFVIQMAVAKGIKVYGSASEKNHNYMKMLGVTATVDYHDLGWMGNIMRLVPNGVEAAMAIQPDTSLSVMAIIKNRGKVISVSGDQFTPLEGITAVKYPYDMPIKEKLILLLNQVDSSEIRLFLKPLQGLDQALDALHRKTQRHARGKSVIILE